MKKLFNIIIAFILSVSFCVMAASCKHDYVGIPDSGNNEPQYTVTTLSDVTSKESQYMISEILQDDLEEYNNGIEYYVEYVQSKYWSQEYIEELYYNSLKNDYFGYDYDEICSAMGDTNWCFTVMDGKTTVIEVPQQSDMLAQLVKKVAIGTGIIVVCAVVSVVSGGVGAAPVACFFAGAAKGALAGAISSGLIGSAIGGLVQGVKTHSFEEAMKGAAEGFGNGFMWGAIAGAITGGLTSGSCFSKDTLIKTEEGYKTINCIDVGDRVYSYNEKKDLYEYAPVTNTFKHNAKDIVVLSTQNEIITTTSTHPFLTNGGWLSAGELQVGDYVTSTNGPIRIEGKTVLNANEEVYNMTVAYNHTYTVSESEIVVHNACGDSTRLRKAMIDNNEVPPSYKHAAHHIVPSSDSRFQAAKDARDILNHFGIDINSPNNGVFLSTDKSIIGTTYHRVLHNADYYSKVLDCLQNAMTKSEVLDGLAFIKQSLMNGTFI